MVRRNRTSSVFACALVSSATLASTAGASRLFSNEFSGPTPLYEMNQATGAATVIGASGFDNVGDLTSDTRTAAGPIWGVKITTNQLLKFDRFTGAASVAATLNSPNSMVSLAFDPVAGKLYGSTSVGFGAPFEALYGIDPATGNCTFIGRITFDNVFALGFDQGGKLYGVSELNDQLISISTVTGNGALIANLQLTQVFDMASRPEDNVMFVADSLTSHLWTLNVVTGAATDVGAYGGTPNIVGLAFAVPEPATATAIVTATALCAAARRRRRTA
jgi:hypothetical protein